MEMGTEWTVYCSRCYCKACNVRGEEGGFVCCYGEFLFSLCPFPLLSLSLLIYFVVGSFGLGLMFTCLHVRGTFCVTVTYTLTDSKAAAAARKEEKGKKTHKSKIAVCAVVVIG